LGEITLVYMMVLILLYSLRAWTEENHLSMDPDYLVYKTQVRWKFIPKVF
jgi:hypothetical protein|tara:strand:+ start:325 stop:474 length:150 start_codon:yes stop_codon:yes gene_type:complete